MKPIRLVMQAFGPYATKQELHFSALEDRTLFLIHGPTGSGKTSILDAMCFALYGDSSGGERTGKSLRSDHADPFLFTEVTFDFSLAGNEYRVFRRPEQERPRKKGSGTSKVKAEATLWKRTGLEDSEEGSVLATQWKRVTDRIQQLIGFKSDQFRQVVMLPQGKFRELITANSRDRQTIMEVLFQTAFYRRVEEALKEAAKGIEQRIKEKGQQQDYILKQAEVETEQELAERLEASGKSLSELKQQVQERKIAEKQAHEAVTAARNIEEKFGELRKAQAALGKLSTRTEEFVQKRSVLANARHAATLVTDERSLDGRLTEAQQADTRLKKVREELDQARVAKEKAEKAYQKEKAREDERNDARKRANELDALTEKVAGFDAAVKESAIAAKEKREREKEYATASELAESLAAALEEKRTALTEAEKTAARIELLSTRLEETRRTTRSLKELHTLRSEEGELGSSLQKVTKRAATIQEALFKEKTDLRLLEKTRLEGRAAILAKGLVPGEPCPVCGSTEHPSPAVWDRELPEDEAIEAKTAHVEELTDELETIKGEQNETEKKLSEKRASVAVHEKNLGELRDKNLKELQSEARQIKKEFDAAAKARDRSQELKQEIAGIEEKARQTAAAKTQAQEKLEEARTRAGQAEAVAEERRSGIPEELRSPTALKAARKKAGARIERLEQALEKAQQDLVEANDGFSSRTSALEAAQEVAAASQQRALIQQQEFASRLLEAGFPDKEAFRSAKRSKADMEKLEKEIDSFEGALSAARDRAKRAAEQVVDLQEPDIRSLEETAKTATDLLEKNLRDEAALSEAVSRTSRLLADFKAVSKELESLEAEYAVVGRISQVANGTNAEGVTFQRFVLSALLDDVLYAASERLKIMSEKRYTLQRVLERADKRIAGGLDLEVFDAYTGTNRPVATLSGGESFLASLALALGLADVVQSYAGGIQLDTIFVDEGFGSLDPEALDLAYRALVDLQKSGRLVGIISHVPELKEQIPTRLEVSAARHGSSARFVTR